jgi:3-phenylpropionate/trans-cinnamate dioxygenase alpha subunit
MAIETKYSVIDLEQGKLNSTIFSDPSIYQDELEKVFGQAWLQVAHDSLLPNHNDFFLSYMGEDPVIVTRDAKGEVHVFLNMCRHRGNRVVRADDGNAKNFMCTYHGWTFSNEGKLVSVPGLQEAYYGELDVENLGLVEAISDTYAGIIFATWAHDAPSLEAYLGDARWYLDTTFNRRDSGMVVYGPQKWTQPVNWKTPVDNCSDNYHTVISHYASALISVRFGRARQDGLGHKALFTSPSEHVFVNGHSLTFRILNDDQPFSGGRVKNDIVELTREHQKAVLPEVERRLGNFRARKIQLSNHTTFPHGVLGFRMAHPKGPTTTEFWHFTVIEKDLPEPVRNARLAAGIYNGAAGMVEQDDIDNWAQVTASGLSPTGRKIQHQISMGSGHENQHHAEFPGSVSERYISENNQRHFYARWQEFMNSKTWADIPIDPITAKFEGTATMKG